MSASSSGYIVVNSATEGEVLVESNFRKPIVPNLIPVMMSNYSITKTTISDLQAQINELKAKIEDLESK